MNQEMTGKRAKPSSKAVRAGKKSAKEALEEALKEVEESNRKEDSDTSGNGSETESLSRF